MNAETTAPKPHIIPLKRPTALLLLGVVLFGAGAAFFYHRAQTNDRGLIINGIITLEAGSADVFYAVFCVLSAAMALGAVLGVIRMSTIKRFCIVIDGDSLVIPSVSLWKSYNEIRIPLDRIVSVARAGHALLIHESDQRYAVPAQWFSQYHPMQETADVIIARVRALHEKRQAKAKEKKRAKNKDIAG